MDEFFIASTNRHFNRTWVNIFGSESANRTSFKTNSGGVFWRDHWPEQKLRQYPRFLSHSLQQHQITIALLTIDFIDCVGIQNVGIDAVPQQRRHYGNETTTYGRHQCRFLANAALLIQIDRTNVRLQIWLHDMCADHTPSQQFLNESLVARQACNVQRRLTEIVQQVRIECTFILPLVDAVDAKSIDFFVMDTLAMNSPSTHRYFFSNSPLNGYSSSKSNMSLRPFMQAVCSGDQFSVVKSCKKQELKLNPPAKGHTWEKSTDTYRLGELFQQ